MALAWLATRAALVWLLLGPHEWVGGDVAYFDMSLWSLREAGLDDTLTEYPVPAVAVVAVPWLLSQLLGIFGIGLGYGALLMAVAVLTDLVFTLLLAHTKSRVAVLTWLLGVPLLGATTYARFDLLPGVLCGVAVLALVRHPRVAALAAALATGIKLWPALLLPPVLAIVRPRRPAVALVVGAGILLAGASVWWGGLGRLFSPLTYQAGRGLQIESVLATPAMLAWWGDPSTWFVGYAPSKSYEIAGPGVDLLLSLSTVLTVGYVVLLALGWARLWWVRDRVTRETALWLTLASVTGFIVVGKVLSPQYLLWLLPIAAAGLAVADSARLRAWTFGLLVAAGMTHVVFPTTYLAITARTDLVWLPVSVLAVRNGLMVVLLAVAVMAAARGLAEDGQRGIELERQPPGPESSGRLTVR